MFLLVPNAAAAGRVSAAGGAGAASSYLSVRTVPTMQVPQPANAPRPRPGRLLLLALAALVVVVLVNSISAAIRRTRPRIAVISIGGMIAATDGSDLLFGATGVGAQRIVREIRDAAEDPHVRAVVVRINSPGGTAAASQEIFEALLAAREQKPFVASLADVAASGGFYVACGCTRIVSNRATLTGSIGVIMHGLDASGLMEWIRVKDQSIKSGPNKDIGSPYRPMTPAQRAVVQQMISEVYEQFLRDVARARQDSVERIRPYADGRILNGETAHRLKLVDQLGGFWDAVALAKELGGMPADADPQIAAPRRRTLLEQLLAARAPAAPAVTLSLPAQPPMPMLWFLANVEPIDARIGQ